MKTNLSAVIATGLVFALSSAQASLVFTVINSTQTIDFNDFDGSGFASDPAAGQLDSDTWRATGFSSDGSFGGDFVSGDFARGTDADGVSTGGIYAFEVGGAGSGDFGLGVQPAGSDFTPGDFTLRIQNSTGTTVSEIGINYDLYVYNDADRANSFDLSYSTDDSNYTSVPAGAFTSAAGASGSPQWVSTGIGTTITGLNLLAGSFFYVQFSGDDIGGSGSRDQFAVDNLNVSVAPEVSTFVPLLGILAVGIFGHRRRKTA
ncbi:MAG: hypothetical protein AAGJ79_02305 [Verrucomicrobiota bacterium]